jgi:hypothetical protein
MQVTVRGFCILALLLFTGCCGFNREWKRVGSESRATDGLAGRWAGHWMSERNGHNGRLRCIVKPATNGVHNARFHAKYWKLLSFGYTAPLRAQISNDVCRFEGEANLGKLAGGVYEYKGTVTRTNWQSTYQSRYDRGYFRMNRVP